jgi:hypothetical protein
MKLAETDKFSLLNKAADIVGQLVTNEGTKFGADRPVELLETLYNKLIALAEKA